MAFPQANWQKVADGPVVANGPKGDGIVTSITAKTVKDTTVHGLTVQSGMKRSWYSRNSLKALADVFTKAASACTILDGLNRPTIETCLETHHQKELFALMLQTGITEEQVLAAAYPDVDWSIDASGNVADYGFTLVDAVPKASGPTATIDGVASLLAMLKANLANGKINAKKGE